jgi:hypothetical protein
MQGESSIAKRFDITVGSGTVASRETLLRTVVNKQLQGMCGLANSVFLWVGAYYIMTNNIDMTD